MSKEKEYCSSKLYVWGETLNPQQVTNLFGIEPDEAWQRGDLKFPDEPSKRHYTHELGCWRLTIDETHKPGDTIEQLEYWCRFLKNNSNAVDLLNAQGYELELDFYIDEGPAVSIKIPSGLLRKLVQFNVSLSLLFIDSDGPVTDV